MSLTKCSQTAVNFLSYLLENDEFDYVLALCETYVNLMRASCAPDMDFACSDDYKEYDFRLKIHGFVISSPEMQANALFSKITNILRTVLDEKVKQQDGRLLIQRELEEALGKSLSEALGGAEEPQ